MPSAAAEQELVVQSAIANYVRAHPYRTAHELREEVHFSQRIERQDIWSAMWSMINTGQLCLTRELRLIFLPEESD